MSASTLATRARQALASSEDRTRSEVVRVFKAFRKLEEERLKMLHRAGDAGSKNCQMRSDLIDEVIKHLWTEAQRLCPVPGVAALPICLVAVGGYGRRCMNPFSDVDLSVIYPGNGALPPKGTAELISTFVSLVWDIKLPLGDHATRSVGETYRQANGNYEIKTSLIDARYLAGEVKPFEDFQAKFDKSCFYKQEAKFLRDRQDDIAARHAKYENTPYRQEPNVKNGVGGLREFHNLQWITYAKFRTIDLNELIKRDFLTATALKEIQAAHNFILQIRTELHYTEKRESDILTLKLQGLVANHLGYRQRGILRRIERLMKDYYGHTVNMLHRTNEVLDRFHLLTLEEEQRGVKGFLALRRASTEKFDGFVAKSSREQKDARINAESPAVFKEDPARLMRLFVHTQQRYLRLGPDLFQLVQKSFPLVDQTFRYSKAVRESFLGILSQKGDVSRVLRQMHRVGLLGKYLPEFGALTNLVQHEFYHQYTADEHTLRCVDRLDDLAGTPKPGNEFFSKLFQDMQEPSMLYLALLLHDAGRALNTAHHATASTDLGDKVCRRLMIKGERRRLLLFLVDNHLELYRTATKQNTDDPAVIESFARVVRNQPYLDALLVFTVVDSKGTSAGGWTSWKEAMILQLYRSTSHYLNDPRDFLRMATAPLDSLKTSVQKLFDATYGADIDAHFDHMPRAYFNFREAEKIAFHIRAIRWHADRIAKDPETADLPTLTWINHLEQGWSDFIVVCRDRPLLLARIAGALSATNINILGADLFRRSDGVVLDIFRVCTVNFEPVSTDRARTRVRQLTERAFKADDFDFSVEIAEHRRPGRGLQEIAEIPQRVYVTNERSQEHTVVELQAADRIGFLYDVFVSIGRLGLNITHARINTEKGAALDSFYIQTMDGQKITDKAVLDELKEVLTKAVFA